MGISKELKRGLRTVRVYSYGVAYGLFVAVLLLSAALSPAYALQVAAINYARVVQQAEMIAFQAAQRATVANVVAAATLIPTPVGVGIKVVAVGLSIGIPLAMALWDTYYSPAQLTQLKTAAAIPGAYTIPGLTASQVLFVGPKAVGNVLAKQTFCDGISVGPFTGSPWDYIVNLQPGLFPAGYQQLLGYANGTCLINAQGHFISSPSTAPVAGASTPATQAQTETFIKALPASDTNSLETHTVTQGAGATAPVHQTGTAETTIPQTVTEGQTVVKPITSVLPTDTVVVKDAPAPANTTTNTVTNNQQNNTNTTNTTTTTTTVTNPDGSTTTTAVGTSTSSDTDTATTACSSGTHEPRTLATVLASHQALWQASGLLASISALSNMAFPGSPPNLVLTTHKFGNFSLDFTGYGWFFLALKTVILSAAGIVAIRIVFVGS